MRRGAVGGPKSTADTDPYTEKIARDNYDEGTLVRKRVGPRCGVWVGHYANDATSDVLEIRNVWANERRTHVTIPADVVTDLVAALEART